MSPSLVQGLFSSRRPAAIIFSIVSIIVGPVNGMFRSWFSTHIGKKVDERIPPWIDGYASSAIMFEANMVGISAAGMHGQPGSVFGRIAAFSLRGFEAVFAVLRQFIAVQTAAARRCAARQARGVNRFFSTAIALAEPMGATTAGEVAKTYNGPATKTLTDKVGHGCLLTRRLRQVATGCGNIQSLRLLTV